MPPFCVVGTLIRSFSPSKPPLSSSASHRRQNNTHATTPQGHDPPVNHTLNALTSVAPSASSRRQQRRAISSVAPLGSSHLQIPHAVSTVPPSTPLRPQPLRMSPPSSSISEKAIEKR
ncbi:uncharacterized protein DS421_1g18070 [Arachis hypogaea]|nr:uncharacterized protein DS421_1g18070 [Arachis hypogaea]